MIGILKYIILFFFYSAAGWIVESTYCSIGEKRFINRGFLTGPMCPIYGTGALVMTVFLYNPFYDKPLFVFLLGMLLCDIVEYITSFLMELLFHARWWDYTYEFLNIKGRICLKHTLYWGIASIMFVYVLHPGIDSIIEGMNDKAIIGITATVLAVFAVDLVHSFIKALDVRNLIMKLTKAIDLVHNGIRSVKNKVEDTIDKGNNYIIEFKNEYIEQIEETVQQATLQFESSKSGKEKKAKNSSRYLRNNFNVEKYAKKQLEKLNELKDSIKAELFENEEKQ